MGADLIVARILDIFRRGRFAIGSRYRNGMLRAAGVSVRGYCWIRPIEIPRLHHNIELTRCSLDRGVVLLCGGEPSDVIKISIGEGTYINRNVFLDAVESINVGAHVAIGPNCYITDHDHGTDIARAPLDQPMVSKPTRLGNRVWLGAAVVVLKGVTIGDDTIVGAGSVVTKDLPAGVIAVGVPARVIRRRTPEGAITP